MAEILDLVSMEDKVVTQGVREDMYEKNLHVRTISVIVINDNGEVFLQWRSAKKAVGPRLFDVSCTGHVKAGESYEQGAVRELKEELGIDVKATDLEELEKHYNDIIRAHTKVYLLEHNGPFKGWEEEADHADWFEPYEATFIANRLDFAATMALERLPELMSEIE